MVSISSFFSKVLSCCIGALKAQADDKWFSVSSLSFWVRKIVCCFPWYLFLLYPQNMRSSCLVCVSWTAVFHLVNYVFNWVTWLKLTGINLSGLWTLMAVLAAHQTWTCSSVSVSFLHWGAQNWTWCSRCSLTPAAVSRTPNGGEQSLPWACWEHSLIRPTMPLVFLAVRAHGWLLLCCFSSGTPRYFPAKLLFDHRDSARTVGMRLIGPRCRAYFGLCWP